MTIAVQSIIGEIGGKPTTNLSYSFKSMVNCGEYQYGCNHDGIFRLNTGDTDDGDVFESSFILATSDFGIRNPKRLRYVYVGFYADAPIMLGVSVDGQVERSYIIENLKDGLQRVRVPIGRDGEGRYWTVRISSNNKFRVDSIDAAIVVRSSGIKGY